MLRTIRITFAKVLLGNPLSRALLRRIALDEAVLVDLLSTERIRNRVLKHPEVREEFERLIERTAVPGDKAAPPQKVIEKGPLAELKAPLSALPFSDIGPALDWGPRPFPLSNHSVCLLPGSDYIVERWLRRLTADASVTLLAHSAMRETAEALAQTYRQVKRYEVLPEDPGAHSEGAKWAAVVIPLEGVGAAIDGVSGYGLPVLQPHEELVTYLWRRGCRQFLFANLAGIQQFEIPFLPEALKKRHAGQRAFVLGDQWDSSAFDPARFRNEVTLVGTAGAFGLCKAGQCPSYWLELDRDAIAAKSLELMELLPRETVRLLPLAAFPLLQGPNMCPTPVASDGVVERVKLAIAMGCHPICLVGVAGAEEMAQAKVFEALQQEAEKAGTQLVTLRQDDAAGVLDKADFDTSLGDPAMAGG